jgi:hypothetical protein
VDQIEVPTYELWELAARFELEYLEKHCRSAARVKANQILATGEGVNYFLKRDIPCYMIDRMIRSLFDARESVITRTRSGGRVPFL